MGVARKWYNWFAGGGARAFTPLDFDAFTSDLVGYANEWSTSRNTGLVVPETTSDSAAIQFVIDRTDETTYFYHYTYTIK